MTDKSRLHVLIKIIAEIIRTEEKYPFPLFLLTLRKAFGISQVVMAKELGFNPLQIFHWERGNFKKPISRERMDKMADYLGMERNLFDSKMMMYLHGRRNGDG